MTHLILGFLLTFFYHGCVKPPTTEDLTQEIPSQFNHQEILNTFLDSNIAPNATNPLNPKEQLELLFYDSILNQLYTTALDENKDLKIMQARILQAKSQLKTAWSEVFPKINATINTNSNHTNNTHSDSTQSLQVGATLSWEADLFGRLRASKNAKESLYYQSLENLKNAEISLLGNITSLYFNLREFSSNILLTQENILILQQILTLTRLKVENGLLSSTEFFDKQDLLSNEQNILESLKMQFEETRNAILILINAQNLPFSTDNSFAFKDPATFNIDTLPINAILWRPDIQASLQSLYAQFYNKASAKANLFPILSFNANISEALTSSQQGGNLIYQIAASLTAPLLNRTQLTQKYLLEDAIFQESYLTLQKTLKTALSEIENAISNTYNMRLQLNNRLQNLKNAKQIHNLSTNRRLNGLIDEIEYLSNKTALNNAQKNLNIAKNSEIQAIITLFKSFGGNLYVSGRNQ